MKISSFNQTQLIQHIDVAVQAASRNAELQLKLKECGLNADTCRKGQKLKEKVLSWQKKQKECLLNAKKAQRHLKQLKNSIDNIYLKHRLAARFVYRDNEEMYQKLQLQTTRSRCFSVWMEQVHCFYDHLSPKAIKQFEIHPQEVKEVRKLMSQLNKLCEVRDRSSEQSQRACELKQKAILKLRQWFRYFIRTASQACKEQTHLLEDMGVVVHSK